MIHRYTAVITAEDKRTLTVCITTCRTEPDNKPEHADEIREAVETKHPKSHLHCVIKGTHFPFEVPL